MNKSLIPTTKFLHRVEDFSCDLTEEWVNALPSKSDDEVLVVGVFSEDRAGGRSTDDGWFGGYIDGVHLEGVRVTRHGTTHERSRRYALAILGADLVAEIEWREASARNEALV